MNPAALVKGPATVNVDLPPAALASPAAGVASALSRRLLRWCPDLGGVLLSYGSVELVGSHSDKGKVEDGNRERESSGSSAEISDYFGFVRVAAAVSDALVFAPTPGMRLEGTVARVGGDYVGVLALGVFSAAVGGAALSGRFELEEVAVEVEEEEEEVEGAPEEEVGVGGAEKTITSRKKTTKKTVMKRAWVCKSDKSHRLVEGQRVLFDVARVRRSDGGFVSILGSLESASSGAVGARGVGAAAAASPSAPVSAPARSSAKKSKSKSEKKSAPSAPVVAAAAAAAAAAASSKRKKAEAGSAEKEKEKESKTKKAKTEKKKKKK